MRTLVSPGQWPGLNFAQARGAGGGIPGTGVSGTVTNAVGGTPVSGGTIQLVRSNTVIATSTPNGSGFYSFAGVAPNDVVRIQPRNDTSIGDAGSFIINPGDTKNFVVIDAGFSNDMQAATTAGIQDTSSPPISTHPMFGYPTGSFAFTAVDGANGQALTVTSDGPGGSKTYKHSYDGVTDVPCTACEGGTCSSTCATNARGNFPWLATADEVCFSILTLCSTNYRCGGPNCEGSQCEHKFSWFSFHLSSGGSATVDIELDMNNSVGGAPNGVSQMRLKIVNNNNGNSATSDGNPNPPAIPADKAMGTYRDVWRRHMVRLSGLLTSTPTLEYYYNEDPTPAISLPIPSNVLNSVAPTGLVVFSPFGRNMNNRPDQACYVLHREVGVYKSRPSLLNTPS